MIHLIFLAISILASLPLSISDQTCYYPDQSVAEDYIPCNSAAKGTQDSGSACCLSRTNSYCTDSGLCYVDGRLYRGGCTDATFSAKGCPGLCTNVNQHARVNLFPCGPGQSGLVECGTGHGPGDCTSNFTLPPQRILLRDDQQPGKPGGINFTDPNARFINLESSSSTASQPGASNTSCAAPTSTQPSSSSSSNSPSSPSALTVGTSVGLPLFVLLLASLAMNYFQHRHYRINIAQYANSSIMSPSIPTTKGDDNGLRPLVPPKPPSSSSRVAQYGELPTTNAIRTGGSRGSGSVSHSVTNSNSNSSNNIRSMSSNIRSMSDSGSLGSPRTAFSQQSATSGNTGAVVGRWRSASRQQHQHQQQQQQLEQDIVETLEIHELGNPSIYSRAVSSISTRPVDLDAGVAAEAGAEAGAVAITGTTDRPRDQKGF